MCEKKYHAAEEQLELARKRASEVRDKVIQPVLKAATDASRSKSAVPWKNVEQSSTASFCKNKFRAQCRAGQGNGLDERFS